MWRVIPVLLAVVLTSCGAQAPDAASAPIQDAGAPPRLAGEWTLAGGTRLLLQDGHLSLVDGPDVWTLADRVIGPPAVSDAGDRIAYCRQGEGVELGSIEVWELGEGARQGPRVLAGGDRPALSPSGEWVAFVSGRTGIASLWLVPFAGGDAVQLTNRGLESRWIPGQAPAGFVPPPHEGPPRFDGDRLVWRSPAGEHSLELPCAGS